MSKERALNIQELHNLAMNIVGKDLEKEGYEFIAVNSKLGKHPQFVCVDKDNQRYFVLVKAVSYPDNPNNYDVVWMETFKQHAVKQKAKVIYAGVGLYNAVDQSQPVLLDRAYLVSYNLQHIPMSLN
ncbi:MAG: Na(+)-translocating NADH-quinone reductase subunit F [Flavobacteriaceae bacterium]|nr:Na(+)-translocating NADH-quinone reductase subunit F [Flavobacteriaceae bacterium]